MIASRAYFQQMVVPGRLGNYFGFPPQEGLWVFSFAVPSRVCFRAGNMVGTLVGFSASLQPNQYAYTKVRQDKVAKCRLRISMLLTATNSHSSCQLLGNNMNSTLCSIHILFISNKFRKFWMSSDCRSRCTKNEQKWAKTQSGGLS